MRSPLPSQTARSWANRRDGPPPLTQNSGFLDDPAASWRDPSNERQDWRSANQVDRLERIFEALGEKPTGKKCRKTRRRIGGSPGSGGRGHRHHFLTVSRRGRLKILRAAMPHYPVVEYLTLLAVFCFTFAALAEAWAVMLFTASIVKVFISSPCRAVGPRGHHM